MVNELTTGADIPVYLAFMYTALIVVCIAIVVYYAEPGFPWHTYLTLIVGYFCSFGVLLLVPIDIAVVIVDRRSSFPSNDPTYNNHVKILSAAYSTFFTIILIFGSFVLVFEEYYNTDGYFSIGGKLASSLYRAVRDTFLGIIVGIIILSILLSKKVVGNSTAALQLAAVIVTNTIYETFLMFLLGYGLVQYPRHLWMQSNLDYYLLRTQMRASSDFKAIGESQLNVSLVVADVMKTKAEIYQYADVKINDAMDILVSECPSEFRSSKMGKVAQNKQGQVTIATLANLRLRLNLTKDRYRMSQGMVGETKLRAYHLEDLTKAKNRTDGVKQIEWSLAGKLSSRREYDWYIVYRPLLFKMASVVSALLSLFSLLGVVCSMDRITPDVSVYFHAVHDPLATAAGIAIFVLFSLGYTTYVTLWALFQIRLAGFMELVPYKTTPESLSFNVRMVARLAAPLAFFYLGWLSENGIKDGPWTANQAPSITTYRNVTVPIPFNSTTVTNATSSPSSLGTASPSYVLPLSHAPSHSPTFKPSAAPSVKPTYAPSISLAPTIVNSTYFPTHSPTNSTTPRNRTIVVATTIDGGLPMPSCFSHFYQLQAVSGLKSTFGTFFPVLLFCVMLLISTNILNRILVLLKADYLQFGAEIVTEAQLKEGRRQLERHKRSTERTVQRSALKEHISKLMTEGGQGAGGMFAQLMGKRAASAGYKKKKGHRDVEVAQIVEPEALSGMVEKKGGLGKKIGVGAVWKEIYAEVQSPGVLVLYKDKSSGASPEKSTGKVKEGGAKGEPKSINLRLAVTFEILQKTGKDSSVHLLIEMSEETLDLKIQPQGDRTPLEESERWKRLLVQWKDYSIDYACINESRVVATSEGSDDEAEAEAEANLEAGVGKKKKKSTGNAFDDLDSLVVDGESGNEFTENPMIKNTKDVGGGGGGGLFGSFFGGGKGKGRSNVEMVPTAVEKRSRPEGIEGWLQKKGSTGGAQLIGADWQKRYCRVDEDKCCLLISKTKDQAVPTSIDLKVVVEMKAYDKGSKGVDPQRFNLEIGDGDATGKVYKFKAKSKEEGQRWLEALEAWREYALTSNY